MSDRYVLVRATDLGLDVIDHYQGGERRAVKNLSGGGSFYGRFGAGFGIVENVQSSHPYRQPVP